MNHLTFLNVKKIFLISCILICVFHSSLEQKPNVCNTPSCRQTAAMISSYVDKSINPCNNFYEYACGNFIKTTKIPSDLGSYGPFQEINEKLFLRIKDVIENMSEMDYKPFELSYNYFKSCMNTDISDQQKGQPLLDILNEVIGGWPILDNSWNEQNFKLINSLLKLFSYNVNYLFSFNVIPDLQDNTKKVLGYYQPSLGLLRELLLGDNFAKQQEDYKKLGTEMIKALVGGNLSQNQIKDIEDLLKFETELAKATIPAAERRDFSKLFNKITYKELKDTLKHVFDVKCFTNKILKDYGGLQDSDPIVLADKEYFMQLEGILKRTPPRVIANYLGWRITIDARAYLSPQLFKEANKINLAMNGIAVEPVRWKTCAKETRETLKLAVGKLYVDKYFSQDSKTEILEVVNSIRDTLTKIIEDVDWMDTSTKKFALQKLKAIPIRAGFPDSFNDPSFLEKEYEGLNFTPDHFYGNQINYQKFEKEKSLRTKNEKEDPEKWKASPADLNALYDPTKNHILILAGILQFPMFEAGRPRSITYGSIGTTAGHEFTHGFDDSGRRFDIHGNIYNWWTNETLDKFNEKVECIVNQYNGYHLPEVDLNVNGKMTAGENVADNGGLREAYIAYKKYLETESDVTLPNLDYTNEQLFFLGYATMWCNVVSNEELRNFVVGDEHSPNKIRVLGSISNLPEFLEAFNCPNDSKMAKNPVCRVW